MPKEPRRTRSAGSQPSLADGDPYVSRIRWSGQIPGALWSLVRSGLKPGPNDSFKWYDRVIRVVGGILIVLVLLAGVVAVWMNQLQK